MQTIMLELWQLDWDKFPENKLHKIFPHLTDLLFPWTKKKEESAIRRLHIGHSCIAQSCLLKGEEPLVCIAYDKQVTIEHV